MTLSWVRLKRPTWAIRYAGPAARKMSAISSSARTCSLGRRLVLHQRHQPVEWPGDCVDRPGRDLGVERGRIEFAVPEQHLDDADVDVLFEQVRGEAVPQRV